MKAGLNLKAVYSVSNVSLDDLTTSSLGFSKTRVDCILNLTGRPEQPAVAFDFDLPNASEDEKQMVRSIVSTEEERNMQAIYLLGLGRFFNTNSEAGTQSEIAMNSIVSSTLSQQLNQFIANAVGNSKWSIGANLKTGDDGWRNMDVEGLLSGKLLDDRLLATPAVAVQRAHEIAGEMAADAAKAMHLAMGLTKKFESGIMEQVVELEDKTDRYEDALNTYLVKLSSMNLSVHDNRILNTLLYTVSDIERVADHAMAISKAALEMEEKKIEFSKQAKGELAVLEQAVLDVVDRTVSAYSSFDREQAVRIEPQEQVVDALVREVKSRHVRRLRDGLCTVEYGFVLEDLLTACERTADHCSNVAVEMLQVAEGKLEAHEYLNALKAGELHESAAFSERFARYKAQYSFPEEN
jgi:phosphate uptake regulator